jgi:hypothetical protein
MERILKYMGVNSSEELCSYVYNHGNNPFFEIFKKEDIRKIDCNKEQWFSQNGYKYSILKGSKAILSESENYHHFCDKIGADFYEMMRLAQGLDDVKKYAQKPEVKFLLPHESIM